MAITYVSTCKDTHSDTKTTTKCTIDTTFWPLDCYADPYQNQDECSNALYGFLNIKSILYSLFNIDD